MVYLVEIASGSFYLDFTVKSPILSVDIVLFEKKKNFASVNLHFNHYIFIF